MDACIRRANKADAETIALLGRITFGEAFGHLFGQHRSNLCDYLDTTFGVSKIERSLANPGNSYWLGFVDRLPVGYAKLKHRSPLPSGGSRPCAQLQKLYVLSDYLGQQLGARLMHAVAQEAAGQAPTLWLDVLRENVRAIRFYQRFGFRMIGEDNHTIGAQTFSFHLMSREVA